ncbi:MAG: hypothetical protein AAB018_06265 [Actinomycetota bacterium]
MPNLVYRAVCYAPVLGDGVSGLLGAAPDGALVAGVLGAALFVSEPPGEVALLEESPLPDELFVLAAVAAAGVLEEDEPERLSVL